MLINIIGDIFLVSISFNVVFKYHCYYLISWVQKDQIPNLDLAYDMLPLMEMMEAPDKSEFFYRHRTEDGWAKKIF